MSGAPATSRFYFFDNVRYIVIIWVTLFHVASGLAGHQEFIRDSNTSVVFSIFHAYSVTVMMAIMFFTAGYFSTASLRNRHTGPFVKNKLVRLGVPWLVGVLFLGPTMPYMAYYSRSFAGLHSDSYWDFWLRYMGSIFDGWLLPINFTANPIFHQQHFWFLSVLFVFFVVHALLRDVRVRWGRVQTEPAADSVVSQWHFARAFLLTGLVAIIGFTLSNRLDLPSGTLAFFLKVSALDVALYGSVYALGVHAHAREWYANRQAPGWKAVGFIALFILAAALGAGAVFFQFGMDSPFLMLFGSAAAVLVNLLSVLGFTSLIHRYMNNPSQINQRFAANSYNVYLVQYPVVLVFRLMNFTWEVSPFVKFVAAGVPALVVSYLISEYLISRRPRLAILAGVGMHVGLCIFGLPRTAFSHQILDRQEQFHAVVPAESRPVALRDERMGSRGWGTSMTGIAWQDGALYFGSTEGLQVMRTEGVWETVDGKSSVSRVAALGQGLLAAAGDGQLSIWSVNQGAAQMVETLSEDNVNELIGDGAGGLFYEQTVEDDQRTLVYRSPDGQERVFNLPIAGAGALSQIHQSMLWTADGQLAVYQLSFSAAGHPRVDRPLAEVFMADGKYGRTRPDYIQHTVSGLTVDRDGRLFLVNRVGLQVFDPNGALLGVVQLPDQPTDCTFGGPDLRTLYIATKDQVYALKTHTAGLPLAPLSGTTNDL
jgi:glucan biosynthesis protein C